MSKTAAAVAHLTSFWSDLFFRPNLPPPPARALEPQPGSDSRAALLLLLLLLPANLTHRFTAASVCPVSPPPVRPSAARRHHAAPSSTNTAVSHTHGNNKRTKKTRGNSIETALPPSSLLDHVLRACLFAHPPPLPCIRQRGTLSSEGFHPARSLPRANRAQNHAHQLCACCCSLFSLPKAR